MTATFGKDIANGSSRTCTHDFPDFRPFLKILFAMKSNMIETRRMASESLQNYLFTPYPWSGRPRWLLSSFLSLKTGGQDHL